jgi:nitrite reductase/ring-hydroxylating ferredoxin subunit
VLINLILEVLKKAVLLICFLSLVFVFSCKKDDTQYVPNVYVNFQLDPNSTMYLGLNQIGGWIYVTGGVKGIIIYREEQDKFKAYDRACPYDYDVSGAIIEAEPSGLTLIDSLCGSRYIITDGSVLNGPAQKGMKAYRTSYDGRTLYVFN